MIKGDIISIDYIGTRGGTRNLSKVIGRTLLNLCERMKSMKGFADEFRPPRVSSIPFFFYHHRINPAFLIRDENENLLSNRFSIVRPRLRRVIWLEIIGNYLCVQSKRLLSFVSARDD